MRWCTRTTAPTCASGLGAPAAPASPTASTGSSVPTTIDGEITAVNDALCQLTGFPRERLVGSRPPFPYWPPEDHERATRQREEVVAAEGGMFELTLMRADGTRFESEARARPARNPDGSLLGFKKVNDDHGHLDGDRVLREIASRLAALTRTGELVARVGERSSPGRCPRPMRRARAAAVVAGG